MNRKPVKPLLLAETFQSADEARRRENLARLLDGYLRRRLQAARESPR